MILGFDIDNVVADLDKSLLNAFLKEDKKKRNAGIVNPNATHITEGMFDWSQEEVNDFLVKNMEKITYHLKPVKKAKYYIHQLKKKGYEIYLITGRNTRLFQNPEALTKKWLKRKKIDYDKLIFAENSKDKTKECIENKINIFFDDRYFICELLQKQGIEAYVFQTRYNERYGINMPKVKDWEDLYHLVEKRKVEE